MATLEINFVNNSRAEGKDTTTKVEGTDHAGIATGINIFAQRFKRDDTFATQQTLYNIIPILKNLITCSEGYTLKVKGDDPTSYDNLETDAKNEAADKFIMKKNQIIVYQCKQGLTDKEYYVYYCYVKDKGNTAASDETKDGNAWLIYIPGPVTDHFKPIIFDLEDDLEPIFTKGDAGDKTNTYVGVSTGNFDLLRKTSGDWETKVKLKNTSFNLAVDDTAENPAVVNFLGVITPQTEQE